MWCVLNDYQLCSLAHHHIWEPGATIEGNLDKIVVRSIWGDRFGGVYSYATKDQLAVEATEYITYSWPLPGFVPIHMVHGVAIGTIKCWGEVIEHEKGYRAQYAKLLSIDKVIGPVDINQLRRRYIV
jgi:hypothetical protein